MILSDVDIRKAIKSGEIKFEPQITEDQIGPGSVDLTLSNEFLKMKTGLRLKPYDLKETNFADLFEEIISESIVIQPGELILAKTLEKITLSPNICGWIQGRSKYARLGISVHVASSFIQPGISNRQVLEIVNLSKIPYTLHSGMRICQVIFQRTITKTSKPYSKFGTYAKQ
jgi:dCTP deaminase